MKERYMGIGVRIGSNQIDLFDIESGKTIPGVEEVKLIYGCAGNQIVTVEALMYVGAVEILESEAPMPLTVETGIENVTAMTDAMESVSEKVRRELENVSAPLGAPSDLPK